MIELVNPHPSVNVPDPEFVRLLGYPLGHVLEGRPQELAEWAKSWYAEHGRPWIYARRAAELRIDKDHLSIEGVEFLPGRLHRQLIDAEADGAFVVAVSAGKECEDRAREAWNEGKPDEYFFLEAYGSAVVEHLVARAAFQICEWADRQHLAVLPHYSPGYPGWDISDQTNLIRAMVGDRLSVFPGGLRVLDSGMPNPKKSLLAVFGVTSHLEKVGRVTDLIPCQNCSLPLCQYRRVPYENPLPRLESVRSLQPPEAGQESGGNEPGSPDSRKAAYTFSTNALRKWAADRLQITKTENGSTEAHFHYEGKTCSNLGRLMDFTYRVKLEQNGRGYTIVDARCAPSPDDEGHKFMCEYIRNGDSFLTTITGEKPMVGTTLEEAIRWKREYSPAGCFCEPASRDHKWGLVFEVLHFALSDGSNRRA